MPTLTIPRPGRAIPFLAAALLAAVALASPARAEEWTKSFTVSGHPQVQVKTNDGAVDVRTGDTKQVDFRVEYHGYELNKNLHIDTRQDGNTVSIEARLTNRFSVVGHWCLFCVDSHRNLRIIVNMPKDADLNVDTGDGGVESQAVNGAVDIHTGDGHINISGAKGDIRLRTGDGHIEAHDLDGKVEATSGDGRVRMDGRFDVLYIKTGDGSIDTRVNPGSKMASAWTIRTGDGSVDLVLPDGFAADVDAQTRDGRISLGFPLTVEGGLSHSQIHGKLNGGGAPLTIHTGDGSIHLRRA